MQNNNLALTLTIIAPSNPGPRPQTIFAFLCLSLSAAVASAQTPAAIAHSTSPGSTDPNPAVLQVSPCTVTVAATTWTCTHNFNDTHVFVQAFDANGLAIIPESVITSKPNIATVHWRTAQAGTVLILHAASVAAASHSGTPAMHEPQSITIPGSFTNVAGNVYLQSIVGIIDPFKVYSTYQGGNYSTFSIIGAIDIPSTSAGSYPGAFGVGGFASSHCNSGARANCNAVGGTFYGQAAVNHAAVWGSNPLAVDLAGTTNTSLVGEEIDVNVDGAPSFVRGLSIPGGGHGTMPSGNSYGIEVQCRSIGTACWGYSAIFGNLGSATSAATPVPAPTIWHSTYWNGTASTDELMGLYVNAGTGANPFFNYIWEHTGTKGSTTWGPQAPLNLGLFTTAGNAAIFTLSSDKATYNKVITVPNGNSIRDTLVLATETQTLANKTLVDPVIHGTPSGDNIPIPAGQYPSFLVYQIGMRRPVS